MILSLLFQLRSHSVNSSSFSLTTQFPLLGGHFPLLVTGDFIVAFGVLSGVSPIVKWPLGYDPVLQREHRRLPVP
jgi:hypothetical protein